MGSTSESLLTELQSCQVGISHLGSCPRPAWAFFVIFFPLHRFASHFPVRSGFFTCTEGVPMLFWVPTPRQRAASIAGGTFISAQSPSSVAGKRPQSFLNISRDVLKAAMSARLAAMRAVRLPFPFGKTMLKYSRIMKTTKANSIKYRALLLMARFLLSANGWRPIANGLIAALSIWTQRIDIESVRVVKSRATVEVRMAPFIHEERFVDIGATPTVLWNS